MSISDLLTQIEVAPGLPGGLTNAAPVKREAGKPLPKTDYRDKLARSLNETSPESRSRETADDSAGSSPSTADRELSSRENPSASRTKPANTRSDRTESGNSTDAAGSSSKPSGTGSNQESAKISATKSEPKPESDIASSEESSVVELGYEEPSAEEISTTAIALLTVTTTAPVLDQADTGAPAVPKGLYQLLQTETLESSFESDLSYSTNNEEDLLPPTGLLEAFEVPVVQAETEQGTVETELKFSPDQVQQKATTSETDLTSDFEFVATTPNTGIIPSESIVTNSSTADQPDVETVSTNTTVALSEEQSLLPLETQSDEGHSEEHAPSDANRNEDVSRHVPNLAPNPSSEIKAAPTEQQSKTHATPEFKPETTSQTQVVTTPQSETQASPKQSASTDQEEISQTNRPQELFTGKDSTTLKSDASQTGQAPGAEKNVGTSSTNPLAAPQPPDVKPSTHVSHRGGGEVKVDAQSLVDRVSNALQQATETGRGLRVRLHPPELGVLQIEITAKDGLLTARLETQTASAHHAIVENLASLREALANSGSHVERIEVQVAENRSSDGLSQHADHQADDDQQQQNARQERQRDQSQQGQEEELDQPVISRGGSIDQLDIQI